MPSPPSTRNWQELTTEASDAVLLGFLPPERRNNAGPASSAGSAAPVPKAEALKWLGLGWGVCHDSEPAPIGLMYGIFTLHLVDI